MTAPPDLSAGLCVGWPNFTEMSVHDQKKICDTPCPVAVECAEWGLRPHPDFPQKKAGIVFGGLPPAEQRRIRKQRRGLQAVKS